MVDNTNKVALVTGASSGMGMDFVESLLKEGMIVYAAARRMERMDKLREMGAHVLKMDITKDTDVRAAITSIEVKHGGVDVLVNNAGFGLYGSMEETSMEDARYQFEVNFFGLARLTQLVLPYMRKQRSGKIINISSVGGKIYTPLGSWYHATKHALEGWSDCLRLEVSQFGIDVVIIEPGGIATEFADVMSENMTKRSGDGPYSHMVKGYLKMFESFGSKMLSKPKVITELILKAVRSGRPKTRYYAGRGAFTLFFLRRLLCDRLFDRVAMSLVR
ncbi:oxidoreductase [Desulfovibrio mangrovi]|uniref:oxidoreductase n=1 Tax=Desulfovibrio mangrovi TaxID=2976983 RepID=UPI00224578F5|nr:oxidoreductase [Desulfovibrio mangrovi]UZP68124.1 oxidoreductase [Desulfovibrio mangrovi]